MRPPPPSSPVSLLIRFVGSGLCLGAMALPAAAGPGGSPVLAELPEPPPLPAAPLPAAPQPIPPLPDFPGQPSLPALPELPTPPSPLPSAGQGPAVPREVLEAAILQRLFQGPFQSGGKLDSEATEWEQARVKGQRPLCTDVGPLQWLQAAVDLDGDGSTEQLVAVLGSYACGSEGCTLLIFRQVGSTLALVAENGLFQSPLRSTGQRTAGWLDLTMPASLYGAQNGQRLLRFDGSTYQPLPSPGQPSPGQPAPAEATAQPVGPPLLEMGAVPFEQIGRTLPCAAALP